MLHDGRDRERLGNGVYGTIGRDFVSADGVRVMIVAINERQWQGLVRALDLGAGLAALEARHGVSFTGDDGVRYRHRDAIYALIEAAMSPEVQSKLMQAPFLVVPTNTKVKMEGEIAKVLAKDHAEMKKRFVFQDWKKINEHRAEWIERFNRDIKV